MSMLKPISEFYKNDCIFVLLKIKSLLSLMFLICLNANAQIGGKNTFAFLDLKLSPVISALQGANIAQPNADPSVAARNPALTSDKMLNRLSLSYNNYLSDINFGNVAYAGKFKNLNVQGGILYINYGKFDGYDDAGQSIGQFTADDYAFYVGTSKEIKPRLTIGGNFKFIYSQLYNNYANGVALDGGLHYQDTSGNTNYGFVIRNAGFLTKNYTKGVPERMPLKIEFSYSKRLAHTPFRFNLLLHDLQNWNMRYAPQDGSVQNTSLDNVVIDTKISRGDNALRHLTLGTELLLGEYTHLRIGYNHQMRKELSPVDRKRMTGFAWGFGIQLFKIHFNYASSAFFPGIASNQFSAVFNLSTIYTKKKKETISETK